MMEELVGLAHPERIHVNLKQRTDEWFAVRRGKITGTDFDKIAPAGARAIQIFCDKATARFSSDYYDPSEPFINSNMRRGIEMEATAKSAYVRERGVRLLEVGFVDYLLDNEFTGWCGCSPDGLVGQDGLVEIKCPTEENFLVQKGRLPLKYVRQAMFNIWATNRRWCDFILYSTSGKLHIQRVHLDSEWRFKIENTMRFAIGEIQKIIHELARVRTAKK
ncbi:MAG: YqaJ viral recombinase family protein [Puniceicoccales bacterium]|nr:YqaJ viral recombinase family protein [Puniceicoccales bacterium]